MSTLEAPSRWMERLSDWANPILVKETRQALKSRQFVVTFMLLLAASWLLSLFGMLLGGADIEFGSVGTRFFQMYFYVLAFAVLVIIPFGCYRSLLAEREQTTFELLSITSLSPRQVIWGKLLSAGLQLFIFYSAIAPFIAFTSLLQGFEIAQVSFLLVAAMLASLEACMAALMVSAMVRAGVWQAIVSLLVLGGLLLLFLMAIPMTEEMQLWFEVSSPEFWWSTADLVLMAGMFFLLFQQIATSQLTFEADNRSTGIRLVCTAQFVLFWVSMLVTVYWLGPAAAPPTLAPAITACAVVSGLYWAVAGLFFVTEDGFLSRRIRRNLPRNALWRLFLVPLLPGGSRGFLFLLINMGLMLAVGTWLSWKYAPSEPQVATFVLCLVCYLVIYLGLACALGRWCAGLSGDIRPGHVRVLTLILFAVGCIGPFVPLVFGATFARAYHPVMITNPLVTLLHVADTQGYSPVIVPVLSAAAGLAVLANLLAVHRGVREVVTADVRTATLPQTA